MIVTAPKDGNEFRHLLYTALNIDDRPFAIRYPKASSVEFDEVGQIELLPLGSWEICKRGTDLAILAVGPMVYTALNVAEKLESKGISIEVVNCRYIKPMDYACLENINNKFSNIITLEEGVITGGFGDGVASWLLENNYSGKLKRLGLPDSFIEHGTRKQILSNLGLDAIGLIRTIEETISKIKEFDFK
tara:strand:- start:1871 stop:2440 length:570 start_codon:yes stop_codon:yes gene_type:complete